MKSTVIPRLLEVYGDDPRPEGPSRRLLVRDPDHLGAIMHSRSFQRTDFIRQLAGAGLLATDGDLWRSRRRLVQPVFPAREPERHRDSVAWAMPGMLERFGRLAAAGESCCLVDEMYRLVNRIVYRSIFGVEVGLDEDRVSFFQPMLEAVGDVHWSLVAPGAVVDGDAIARLHATRADADVEIDRLMRDRRRVDLGLDDALGRLLAAEEAGEIDEVAVRDEVRSMVLAATETTANALAWCLVLLDANPGFRAGLEGELDAGDEATAWRLDGVILETLRLFPPVWANERQAVEPVEEAGRTWAAGDRAVISTYHLHRNPELWTDPDRFDPGRFQPTSEGPWRPAHRFAYFPFGAGPHLCIGRHLAMLEMRWILGRLLGAFRVEFVDPGAIEPILGVVLRPTTPMRVRFHRRDEVPDRDRRKTIP